MRKITILSSMLFVLTLILAACAQLGPVPVSPPPTPTSAQVLASPPTVAPAPTTLDEAVTFPDVKLEAAIREALNKPEGTIHASDLKSLTKLEDIYSGISDITGLEYCTNLTKLTLSGNEISDLSPLSRLTNLQWLWLSSNQISDISALSRLTDLQTLNLSSNRTSDLAPLSRLTNLQWLGFNHNGISDISALGRLTNLQELQLYNNQISDISALSRLTKLKKLLLHNNQISVIPALGELTNLQELALSGNQISDISALRKPTNLRLLLLEDNPLSVVSANIYIIQLGLSGVHVGGTGLTVLPTIILVTVLVLVAMSGRRIANWGLVLRFLQLSLIIIVGGLAYYLALTATLKAVAFPLGFFASILVGFGTIVTFWSCRGWGWNLVASALIALWIVYLFTMSGSSIPEDSNLATVITLSSAPFLAAAGVFLVLHRVSRDIAILASIAVILVYAICLILLWTCAMPRMG
ncbi:leucine-rich repeat domain-containing protein [Chloroflexota bacterium]